MIAQYLVFLPNGKIFLILAKNSSETEIELFPVVRYVTKNQNLSQIFFPWLQLYYSYSLNYFLSLPDFQCQVILTFLFFLFCCFLYHLVSFVVFHSFVEITPVECLSTNSDKSIGWRNNQYQVELKIIGLARSLPKILKFQTKNVKIFLSHFN